MVIKKSFLATPHRLAEACREDYEGKDREISKRSGTKNPPRIRLVDVGDVIKKLGGYFRGMSI